MKIGLYFGSFNPIHNGHLIIANYIQQYNDLDQVWIVVSPQNPHKENHTLLNEYHRLHLVRLAVQGFDRKWRLKQEKLSPCYTTRFGDILEVNICK